MDIEYNSEQLTPFETLEPSVLERGISRLINTYQVTRSAFWAWYVASYAFALCKHPDFEGSDDERCVYRRMAKQWLLIAESVHHRNQEQGAFKGEAA